MLLRHFRCSGVGWERAHARVDAALEALGFPRSSRRHDTVGFLRWMGLEEALAREHGWSRQLGEIARFDERWSEAVDYYERAAEAYRDLGGRMGHVARLNRAMADIPNGDHDRARETFEELAETLPAVGLASRLPRVHLGLAACAAADGEWQVWDERIARWEASADEFGKPHGDDAWLAELNGDYAGEAGHRERAARMYRVSMRLWDELGRDERADGVRAKLE